MQKQDLENIVRGMWEEIYQMPSRWKGIKLLINFASIFDKSVSEVLLSDFKFFLNI